MCEDDKLTNITKLICDTGPASLVSQMSPSAPAGVYLTAYYMI